MLSIYKASAGSGKTFTLTREYLRMLLRMPIPHNDRRLPHTYVLAVTFTKKATAEMKDRILRELFILAHTPEDSEYIQDFLSDDNIHLNILQIKEKAHLLLIGILQDYSRFNVSTIDGFFQQVIRTFAMELDLSATYDLSMDGEEMVQQAVDEMFIRIRQQKDDNQALMSWILEFILKKIQDDKRWDPSNSIKLFSNQLLKEQLIRHMDEIQEVFEDKDTMRQYQQQLQQICSAAEQQVSHLLQQCLSIFSTEEGWNKLLIKLFMRPASRWLSEDLGANFIKVINDPNAVYTKSTTKKPQQQHLLSIYQNHLSPLFHQLYEYATGTLSRDYITANAILPNLYTMGILQDVAKQIETTNRNLGRLPISETNRLVNQVIDGQETPFIYERMGQYFRHYMMDEFQDTSTLQWENFSPLIADAESQNRDNLIVGDVKQSIYRFRNSDWHLLNQVSGQFSNTLMPKMTHNYRTAPQVIAYNEKLMEAYSQWIADQIDSLTHCPQLSQDIRDMYSHCEMHQEPAKNYEGYFHMQFFEGKKTQDARFEAVLQQLQSFEQEGINLSRVTILTRIGKEAKAISEFLIQHGYNIQSSEGLTIGNHPTIQLIINILKQEDDHFDSISEAYIHQTLGTLTPEQQASIAATRHLPLYEQVQSLIHELKLNNQRDVIPYLIALQDTIYSFMQNRVADTKAFLEFWERKGRLTKIAAPATAQAIRVMTIHSSKGLEFDIVMLPCFDWELNPLKTNDIIWCRPTTQPFSTLPLVAVHPTQSLLKSHLADDYIQEWIAQYIDHLNVTYVAITRPRYRLYAYGPLYTSADSLTNIGQLVSYLFRDQLDEHHIYSSLMPNQLQPAALPPEKPNTTTTIDAHYASSPIQSRLILRSRAEDDFAEDTPLSLVDLGIKMHLWLSYIRTWQDAEPALRRLIIQGQITEKQATELRSQLTLLQTLIHNNNHDDWFSEDYQVISERDIITPSNTMQRPDRIMCKGNHAIVIDYKFGHKPRPSHLEQVRDYMLLLQQMGYTTEGYIIYNALQTIQSISL